MGMNFLDRLYSNFFLSQLRKKELDKDQMELFVLNVKKHRRIFILILFVVPYVYFTISNFYFNQIDTVISSLFGVLLISGTAWYAVTFGAIPVKFMSFAINITAYLFTSLAVSMASVFIAASIATPLLSPVMFIAFYTLYVASVQYDVADALKLGIDETIYQHAKVGRLYFTRELKKKDRPVTTEQKKDEGK